MVNYMYLRFIDKQGSMRLDHGRVYDVIIKTKGEYIYVIIPTFEFRDKVFRRWECPYSSPQTLSENWETVNKEINLK